jgi:peptide methionine sulfoxide reductase msrA/msrB
MFINHPDILNTEEVIVAGGCFWGIEHLFKALPGILLTEVGYIGGLTNNPSYQEVCQGKTQHFEAVRVIYDPRVLDLKTIYQYFFEIHDPSQAHGQGPDIGYQYQSAIFYYNNAQKETALTCIKMLEHKGDNIATQLLPMQPFWRAELAHQNYYEKHQKQPYCHRYTKRF